MYLTFCSDSFISGNRVPSMPEEGATRELHSYIKSWQSKQHKPKWHWMIALEALFPRDAALRNTCHGGLQPQAPPSFTAMWAGRRQHRCHGVPKHMVLLWAYRKPPAWICPTRSQTTFLQSINPLNLMFLELKSAILKQLKHDGDTNKNTIHELCCCKAAGFEVGYSLSRSSALQCSWTRTEGLREHR